jgi:hypothetical protein
MKIKQHPYEFKLIPARDIAVNRLYQRDIHKDVINRIVKNFDYHKVNPVKVSFRDGVYYAFDGQHTAIGLYTKFGQDYLVPCLVYYDVCAWTDEGALFEGTNDKKLHKSVSEVELWKSRLARGEEKATKIMRICEKYALKIPVDKRSSGDGWIRCLNALEGIYNDGGDQIFNEVMLIISSSWHGKKDSLVAPILRGMTMFVKTYYGEYNRDDLIKRLSKRQASEIVSAGKASVAAGNAKYAREILETYNRFTRANRLEYKI